MSQVKKVEVEQAILDSANELFRKYGYTSTTMAAISKRAGIAASTIYVYFRSKVEVLFAVYTPWLEGQLADMDAELVGVRDLQERICIVLDWMWVRIPSQDNFFSNELIAAISTVTSKDHYSQEPFIRIRQRIAIALLGDLPERPELPAIDLATIVLMAYDGFSIRTRSEAAPTDPTLIRKFAAIFS